MNKGVQIFLLVLLFGVGVVGGYFIGGALPLGDSKSDTQKSTKTEVKSIPAEPVRQVVTKPEITDCTAPELGSNGKYSFVVTAKVESNDALQYVLYKDAECTVHVLENNDGIFEEVIPSQNLYYVAVRNISTNEMSNVKEIKGCDVPKSEPKTNEVQSGPVTPKFTRAELSSIINSASTMPSDWRNKCVGNGAITIKIDNADMVIDENMPFPKDLTDLQTPVTWGEWKTVDILEDRYNKQTGKLEYLRVRVNK